MGQREAEVRHYGFMAVKQEKKMTSKRHFYSQECFLVPFPFILVFHFFSYLLKDSMELE